MYSYDGFRLVFKLCHIFIKRNSEIKLLVTQNKENKNVDGEIHPGKVVAHKPRPQRPRFNAPTPKYSEQIAVSTFLLNLTEDTKK
jgi:hypothetical protein